MSTQSAGNEPPTNLASSSHNPARSTPGSLSDNVGSVKTAVLSILKDTVWPRRSTDTARDLRRIIENASSLTNIPKDDHHIQIEHRASLEQLIAVLGGVRSKLQAASNTYGEKKKGFRGKVKQVLEYKERSKCNQVLESCRTEVKDALAPLPNVPTLGPVGGKIGHEANTLPQAVTSQSTMAAPPPDQDAPVIPDDQFNDPPKRREWLGGVKTAFTVVEGIVGTIPVVGTYVAAAAKTGAAIVDIIQKIDGNEEAAKSLASNALQLSEILKPFKDRSVEKHEGEFTKLMSNLQLELHRVQDRIAELKSTSVLEKAFLSGDHADTLKQYDKAIREEQQKLLDRLGNASYGARGDSIDDVICLEGTRVEILDDINA
ncbi:hypothetical protein FRC01_002657, partial [Tulasnella sp. 417]